MNRYQLAGDGYFTRDGRRFIPVGANYWPGSCGVDLWTRWPEAEIRHDLDVLKKLGLNTIRFFQLWQDFEPVAGRYDRRSFDRLRQMLQWCREREIAAHPSLFVGFMSGGIFWPTWRAGRNVFADAEMTARAAAFAKESARVMAEFADTILAIDHGNEMCCLPDAHMAAPACVRDWTETINNAIREVWPDAVLMSGHEQGQCNTDSGFRLGDQPGCDLYSMHSYPVPAWHPVPFDGMTDPLASSLLPLYTQMARAFGPVMVQEFGTIITASAAKQTSYLTRMLDGCWQAGGNGYLWWCLRDIKAEIHPYTKNPFERGLGLVDANDRVKPGLESFVEFARSLADRPAPVADADAVGLYLPRHFYDRESPANPGNKPGEVTSRLILANHLIRRLDRTTRIVRGDLLKIPADVKTLVIAGALVDLPEIDALAKWVTAGGRLIWHGVDPTADCDRLQALIGARALDYRMPTAVTVNAFGRSWRFGQFPRRTRCEYEPLTAKVIAADQQGVPMVLSNDVGRGRVVWTAPAVDACVVDDAKDVAARDAWTEWYRGVLGA